MRHKKRDRRRKLLSKLSGPGNADFIPTIFPMQWDDGVDITWNDGVQLLWDN